MSVSEKLEAAVIRFELLAENVCLQVDDSADPTTALEEILQAPDRLKDLDLDAFAEELKRQVS